MRFLRLATVLAFSALPFITHAAELSLDEIVAKGFSRKIVQKVLHLIDRNEYKRRQSPPGIKITPKAFGRDRRLPITNRSKA